MLTENDYEVKNGNTFEMFGKKWFTHQLHTSWACTINGEILYAKKKILKPKMTDLGLSIYVCLSGEWQLYLVANLVYETFNNMEEAGLVSHVDGDITNNNINNLELAQ